MKKTVIAIALSLVAASGAQAATTKYYSRQRLPNMAAAVVPPPQLCPTVVAGKALPYSGLIKNFGKIGNASSAAAAAGVCNQYIADNKLTGNFECGWYVYGGSTAVSMVQVSSAGFSATDASYWASYCPSK